MLVMAEQGTVGQTILVKGGYNHGNPLPRPDFFQLAPLLSVY
jgi:hypothetical protein